MQQRNIAKKYARAFFESFDPDRLAVANSVLKDLEANWAAAPEIQEFFNDPTVKINDKHEVIDQASAKDHPRTNALLKLMLENKRLDLLPLVAEIFNQLYERFLELHKVTIVTAEKLSDAEQAELLAKLSKDLEHEVSAQWQVDPTIIAGFKLIAGDKVLDHSVNGSLEKFSLSLVA